jgi:sugar O-acyltransferase (sialic acid O-acetyltransferase NeuD family)
MSKPAIVLIGAGGHSLACIDVIELSGLFQIEAIVGNAGEAGQQRLGYPVLGGDECLERLAGASRSALICVGQLKSPQTRIGLFERVQALGFNIPVVISPLAWVSPHARIGAGSIIMHGAIVNAGAVVGSNCIINTRALVEHGAAIGDHCHISTGAILNGDVQVGNGCFVGSNASVRQKIRIGERCVIGLGQAVVADCPDDAWLPSPNVKS